MDTPFGNYQDGLKRYADFLKVVKQLEQDQSDEKTQQGHKLSTKATMALILLKFSRVHAEKWSEDSRLETVRNEIYGEITGLRSEITTMREEMKELSSKLEELTVSKRKQQREKIPSDLSVR